MSIQININGVNELDLNLPGNTTVSINSGAVTISNAPASVALTPGSPGNFTVAHGLGKMPVSVVINMTSGGAIWFQTPTSWDATNLYLTASAGGITGFALVS